MKCTCNYFAEDCGAGLTAFVAQYEPDCPQHSVHEWSEQEQMYVLKEEK